VTAAGIYPMRVVTRLTGLSPDTIRAWERRYRAIEPDRTGGNARRYRDADIQRLTRLAALTAEGHSISALAPLSDEALSALAASSVRSMAALRSAKDEKSTLLDQYLAAIDAFDPQLAEERLMRAASLFSSREVALDLIAPLMREVGERWHDGDFDVAREHLVSAHARALLGTLLRTHSVAKGAPRIVTAAPPGHTHDIGAMIAAILCASRGVIPVHLGADLPYPDLQRAAQAAGASVIALSVARDVSEAELAVARAELPRLAAHADVWIGAPAGNALALLPGIRAFDSFESFDTAVLHRFPGG
jgi:DNA-binding transcriptional MerR regulator